MSCKIYFIQCLETNEIYIGSTIKKYLCQRIACHKYDHHCVATQILNRGNYVCEILEEVEESQRYIREQYYIDTTDCINHNRSFTGLGHNEYMKQYRLDYKDEIKKQRSQKYTCECGSVLTLRNKLRHFKSEKHQNFIKSSH